MPLEGAPSTIFAPVGMRQGSGAAVVRGPRRKTDNAPEKAQSGSAAPPEGGEVSAALFERSARRHRRDASPRRAAFQEETDG
jgi:hypothetical protein